MTEFKSPLDQSAGNFAWDVAGIRDSDGDGKGEILVGAYGEKPDGSPVGRAYRFDGSALTVLQAYDSTMPISFGSFGNAVSAIPDVNNDGHDDIVVGAGGEGTDPVDQGAVYVFDGASGAFLRRIVSPDPTEAGALGTDVAGIADLNGDGRGDLIVGAPNENQLQGRVYIFDGAGGTTLRTIPYPAASQVTATHFGRAVAAVPDANGDGLPDILVGAPNATVGASSPGRAYLFSGATGALLRTLSSSSPIPAGSFGGSVAGIPDVTGDGRGDLLIGAWGENPGGNSTKGRVRVYDGSTGALQRTILPPNNSATPSRACAISGRTKASSIWSARRRAPIFSRA